jgi:hypothetical protein
LASKEFSDDVPPVGRCAVENLLEFGSTVE